MGAINIPTFLPSYLLSLGKSFPLTKLSRLVWFIEVSRPGTQHTVGWRRIE